MRITFLGTGTSQGVPVIGCHCEVCRSPSPQDKRLRTSILVEIDRQVLLIDTGPDFRQQMLRENVQQLDAIIYTHEHKDHTAGLDDVRAFNFKQRKAADIYATRQVQAALKKSYDYIFENAKYPGVPKVTLHTIRNQPFEINGIPILPIEVMHYKMPVFGFRFGDFTYITDANFIAPEEKEKIQGTGILVLNALRKEDHISHFTLEEAILLSEELQANETYLIHISHQMGRHETISKELPANVHLGYDGLRLHL